MLLQGGFPERDVLIYQVVHGTDRRGVRVIGRRHTLGLPSLAAFSRSMIIMFLKYIRGCNRFDLRVSGYKPLLWFFSGMGGGYCNLFDFFCFWM